MSAKSTGRAQNKTDPDPSRTDVAELLRKTHASGHGLARDIAEEYLAQIHADRHQRDEAS